VAFRRPHVVAAIPVALAIRIPNVCTVSVRRIPVEEEGYRC
jgi:hypothetical protein